MASKYRYYKHIFINNIYRVDNFDNVYLFMGKKGFHKLGARVWGVGHEQSFYNEISEEEATLEILNG